MSTSSNYFLHVLWRLAVLLSPVLPVQAAPEVGNDWAIHGFVSLGYIQSEGNNFYGKTLRSAGDVDYYEAGLNAFQSWGPNFSMAGQLLSRQAGRTEAGRPQIDYAFVDFHPDDGHYGLRLGRVKNPMGFFNEARDVLATRPSILLPQSIYYEGVGIRELLFSGDGAQLYGTFSQGNAQTSLTANFLLDKQGSSLMERKFAALSPMIESIQLTVKKPVFIQLLHEIDEGRQRYALGYAKFPVSGHIKLLTQPLRASYSLDTDSWIASAQYNFEKVSVTGEYRYTVDKTRLDGLLLGRNTQQAGYLQLDYRWDEKLTLFARQDYLARHGSAGQAARDRVLGLGWQLSQRWRLNGEYHWMNGQGLVPAIDNPQGTRDKTRLLAVMLGYQF